MPRLLVTFVDLASGHLPDWAPGKMAALTCRRCRSEFVRRSSRKTLAERLLSLVYVFPFRCQLCQHRFLAFRWRERWLRAAGGGTDERREYERLPVQAWSSLWWRDRQGEARGTRSEERRVGKE